MKQPAIIVNITSLILLVSLFLFTPFADYKKLVVLGLLLIMWIISALLVDSKAMRDTVSLFALLFVLMLIQWAFSMATGEHDQLRRFFTQLLWTYIWGVLGVYYASNISLFKRCIPFVVAMIGISCIYTIIGNITIPGASRMLAGSETEGSQMYTLIKSMNIGGYGFIYALVFLIFPSTLWLTQKMGFRIVSILFLFLLLATLIVGSYFLSILLAVVALAISLSSTGKIAKFLILFTIFALIIFALKDYLLRWLVDFGAYINSPMLQARAQELLEGSYQDAYDSAGDYSRFDRMINALHNIAQSPIIGRMTSRYLDIQPSGHSEFLGYFERFGLFGVFPIYYFYSVYKRIKKKASTQEMRLRISVFFILFFIFIFLNTFDTANSTGCVVFLIAPCTMLYIEAKKNVMTVNK